MPYKTVKEEEKVEDVLVRTSRHIPVFLGSKLNKIRKDLNLSQTEMLGKIKSHLEKPDNGILKRLSIFREDRLFRSSISGYDLGTKMPPYYVLMAYAEIANVYLEVLYDDSLELESEEKMPYKKKNQGTQNLFIPISKTDQIEDLWNKKREKKTKARLERDKKNAAKDT